MKKLRITVFLLTIMFGSYAFAEENSETKPQCKSSTFNASLTVKDVYNEGLVLVLNDGSEWDIKYYDGEWKLLGWGCSEQQEVSHWAMGDTIEIKYPGSGNFIDFVLLMTNLSKKEEAWATLKQAPSLDHSDCLYVVDFDKETNHITLNDGTAWFKTTPDMYGAFFQQKHPSEVKWESGNALTLIRGEGWLNANTFFLWNHATNEIPVVDRLE